MEAGGAGLTAMPLRKQEPDIAVVVTLQELDLDTILLALKLVAIDLTEHLQTVWLTRWVWSN